MGALKVRINGDWETVAVPAEPSLDEVWVGSSSPDPALPYQIWYDTSTEPGILRVKRENGVWETVDVTATSEVSVSATDPYDADPQATDELWFDTTTMTLWYRSDDPTPHWRPTTEIPANEVFVGLDEPTPDVELWYDPAAVATRGPSEIPIGGLTHQALTKRTDQDGEVEWSGPHLKLSGGTMESGAKIQFPNVADVPKINYYADTFGVGIEGGTQTIFASSRVRFRVGTPVDAARGGITSPEVAAIEAGGMLIGGAWVPIGKKSVSLAIVAGSWYFLGHGGRPAGVRWAFGATNGQAGAQAASGTGAIYQGTDSLVYSTVGVSSHSLYGTKLFNRVQWGFASSNYGLFFRAAATATVNVGVEVSNLHEANPTVARAPSLASVSNHYGGVDL